MGLSCPIRWRPTIIRVIEKRVFFLFSMLIRFSNQTEHLFWGVYLVMKICSQEAENGNNGDNLLYLVVAQLTQGGPKENWADSGSGVGQAFSRIWREEGFCGAEQQGQGWGLHLTGAGTSQTKEKLSALGLGRSLVPLGQRASLGRGEGEMIKQEREARSQLRGPHVPY